MTVDVQAIKEQVAARAEVLDRVRHEVGKVLVGQKEMVDHLLLALLCGGHVLLEGVPGLAKTLTVNTLSRALNTKFQRIQFTPDLLPADLIGTLIYNPREGTFSTKKGPIFANIVLADEINRAPSKVQSALLEAMQEKQVTIGEETFKLEEPFLVLATQNPIEQEGTYPLPEAQVDRFMFKVVVDYPSKSDEREVVERALGTTHREVNAVVDPDEIFQCRDVLQMIYVDEKVKQYVVDLVYATRRPTDYDLAELDPLIDFGASPRASICLTQAARANAFLHGRGYVTPQDVKDIAPSVMRHRVVLSYEAEAEQTSADDVVSRVLAKVPVP